MDIYIDGDLEKVIAFMQTHVPAAKLVAVANSLKELSMSLWGHHQSEDIEAISLRNEPIISCAEHRQSSSSEQFLGLVCVGGGFVGA